MTYQTEIEVDGTSVKTLSDILPSSGPMKMLIVGKTPALKSVEVGHYFQGQHGTMFWNKLKEYGLLSVPPGKYEDEVLLDHGYGITDIVKVPRSYGNEPSDAAYKAGLERMIGLISKLQPTVLLFVYKRVLDRILLLKRARVQTTNYGFNPSLEYVFGCQIFVFPMPGVGGITKMIISQAMEDLRSVGKTSFVAR
jgi:G:T/U-mismatch repair DNA glycosylase